MEATATQLVQTGAAGNTATATGTQFLTFVVSGEEYGVDILRVQEIKGWTPVTRIPNTPPHVQGVLNLRGTIVPIIDMRMRFGMDKADYTALTVIIVLSVHTQWGNRVIGVVVDAVSDVLDVAPADIKPAPDFGTTVNTEFISGLATTGNSMVMLLDIDRLLNQDELSAIGDLADS
jgi:purine-binding chemotaxis protein CheW